MRPALFLLLAAILCALNAPAQDAPAPPAAPPQSAPPVAATPPAAPVTTTPVQTPSAQATPASPPAVPSPSATDDKELTRLEEKINRLEDKRIDEVTANVERNANWVVGWTQIGLAILGILAAVLSIGVGMIGKWAKEQVKAAQEQTSSMMKAVAEAEKQVQDATDALKKAQEQTADTMKAVVEAKQQLEEARNTLKEAQDLGSQVKLMHKASLEQPPTPATIRAATAIADNEDAEMPDRLMAKALMYQSKKMWKEAAAKWQELVDLQPDNIRARFGAAATMGGLANEEEDKEKERDLRKAACEKYAEITEAEPTIENAWYNWGVELGRLADIEKDEDRKRKLLHAACAKFGKATDYDPEMVKAWHDWGMVLLTLARIENDEETKRALLRDASEKYARALEIDPKYADAFNNLCVSLLTRAALAPQSSEERSSLLDQAEQAALKAHELVPGKGLYNLACVAALRGDKDKCREWLEKAEGLGALPTVTHLEEDTDMDPVREEAWFKELLERMRAREAAAGGEDGKA